jgi:hypothetical protein
MTRLAAEIGQTFNDILPHCPQDVRKEVDFALEGVKKFYWHMARLEYACRGRGCEDVGDTL